MALEDREKKMLIVLGAVAGLAVVVFLVMTLFGGGDEPVTVDDGGAPVADGSTPDTTTPPDTGTEVAPSPPPPTNLNQFFFSDRDIFSPIPSPVLSSSVSPSPGGDDDGDSAATPSEVNIDGHSIRLDAVIVRKTPVVDVTVDGSSYRAGIGDKVTSGFTVDSIDTSTFCATFTYKSGSVEDEFSLCVA